MCVILVGKIDRSLHHRALTENPDGFSLYTSQQGLVKSPTEAQVREALGQFCIWHYRIATSGKIDKDGIHPFEICGGSKLLYHNGILGQGTKNLSDTAMLADFLFDTSLATARSVLMSLSEGNRFLLTDAEDPRKFEVFGSWVIDRGVLCSHRMYSSHVYSGLEISSSNLNQGVSEYVF